MKIRTFTKRLNATELGKGGTNDTYVAIPNEADLSTMFINNVAMTIEDRKNGQVYAPPEFNIKYIQTGQNNQDRISGLGKYFRNNLANVGDEIIFERQEDKTGNVQYYINLEHRDVIVLQKGKIYAEIIRTGALPQYAIDRNYRIEVFYKGKRCVLDVVFMETSIEACEYSETFLHLTPFMGVILNIDNDHLEYYGTMGRLKMAFQKFALLSRTVVFNMDDRNTVDVVNSIDRPVFSFGINEEARFRAVNIQEYRPGFYEFDVLELGEQFAHIKLGVPGYHNIYNALAMCCCVRPLGLQPADAERAAAEFHGTGRRFEIKGECNGAPVVDDYAHHPTELAATMATAKKMGYKRIIAVHQPFTYSRTKALMDDFAAVLRQADQCVLLPIMGSREVDDGSVKSEDLAAKIPGSIVVDGLESAANWVKQNAREGDLVVCMSCGDLYKACDMMVGKA